MQVQAEAVHLYIDAPVGQNSVYTAALPRPPHPLPTNEQGTLHICSHSVVFEPTALHLPMVRVPFRETTSLGEHADTAKAKAARAKKMEKKKKKRHNSVGPEEAGAGQRARALAKPRGATKPKDNARPDTPEAAAHGICIYVC